MPGLCILIDYAQAPTTGIEAMCARLTHDKAWFASKTFSFGQGYHGVVNFAPQLAHSYATTPQGHQLLLYGEVWPYANPPIDWTPGHSAAWVLSLYANCGTEFVKYLGGSFCLSLYDAQTQCLIVVTDRFGSKALYHDTRQSTRFVVASEIKSLLIHNSSPLTYNAKSVVNLLTIQHLLDNETFFEGIELLPPASMVTYDLRAKTLQTTRYWQYDLQDEPAALDGVPLPTLVEQYETVMLDAIERRMAPHDRIGAFISGGIDSRLMLGFAKQVAKKLNKHLIACTFGTENGYQPTPAKRIAKALGVEHHFYPIPDDMLSRYAWDVVWNGDGLIRIRDGHFVSWLDKLRDDLDIVLADYMSGVYFGAHVTPAMVTMYNKADLADCIFKRIRIDFIADRASDIISKDFVPNFDQLARSNFDTTLQAIPSDVPYKVAHYWDIHQRGRRYILPITNYPRWYILCEDPCIDNQVTDFAFGLPAKLLVRKNFLEKVQQIRFPELNPISYEWKPPLSYSRPLRFMFKLRRYLSLRAAFAIQKYTGGNILIKNKDYRAYDYWIRTASRDLFENIIMDDAYFEGLFIDPQSLRKIFEEHIACQHDHDQLICDALNLIMMHHYFVRKA